MELQWEHLLSTFICLVWSIMDLYGYQKYKGSFYFYLAVLNGELSFYSKNLDIFSKHFCFANFTLNYILKVEISSPGKIP